MGEPNADELRGRCDLLRSLHRPGDPLLLPNAWDVATARAVAASGFPAVATTSMGVAAALGYEDHEHAPAEEMFAAAARIARGVDVPVTVDAEAGYGMDPTELVDALRGAGVAGCNLEETDHRTGSLSDVDDQAAWLAEVRAAANAADYPLVINARVDGLLVPFMTGADASVQLELLDDLVARSNAYLAAGADCVYPIALWEPEALTRYLADVDGAVNVTKVPPSRPLDELAAMGVARVSWAVFLFAEAMGHLSERLASLRN
jgi:2-methylisocitrate lyase-like PEP mutase family enzyme